MVQKHAWGSLVIVQSQQANEGTWSGNKKEREAPAGRDKKGLDIDSSNRGCE